jgi:hypothetical protein
MIFEDLKKMGRADVHPALVEAWMRLEYGTLDHLPKETFRKFEREVIGLFDDGHKTNLVMNAESHGYHVTDQVLGTNSVN